MHLGTAAVPVQVRPLAADIARLRLARPLPLQVGDRAILSDHTRHHLPRGVVVLDVDPLPLRRRGAAAARAAQLAVIDGAPTLADQLDWRGAIRASDLAAWGVAIEPPAGTPSVGDWLVAPDRWTGWIEALRRAVRARQETSPPTRCCPGGGGRRRRTPRPRAGRRAGDRCRPAAEPIGRR